MTRYFAAISSVPPSPHHRGADLAGWGGEKWDRGACVLVLLSKAAHTRFRSFKWPWRDKVCGFLQVCERGGEAAPAARAVAAPCSAFSLPRDGCCWRDPRGDPPWGGEP